MTALMMLVLPAPDAAGVTIADLGVWNVID
jgi:hypothetical protein